MSLYLCATPIGNMEDITLRALRVLQEVNLIAAEDTRRTRKLLSYYNIHTPLISYHEHNKKERGKYILDLLLKRKQIALVTDAGLPGISDPGEELVALVVKHGIQVVPVPGSNAALAGLVVSGLPASRFCFEGFLPVHPKERKERLACLKDEKRTVIFYEAPHRLPKTLSDLLEILGDRQIAVARELTKLHEQIWRGRLSEAIVRFKEPRGEFTLVIAGSDDKKNELVDWQTVLRQVFCLEAGGMKRQQAIKEVARLYNLPKREVYSAILKIKTPS